MPRFKADEFACRECRSNLRLFDDPWHPGNLFPLHVELGPAAALPACPLRTGLMGRLLLPRFAPPFLTYVPFAPGAALVDSDGAMGSLRYFPEVSPYRRGLRSLQAAAR